MRMRLKVSLVKLLILLYSTNISLPPLDLLASSELTLRSQSLAEEPKQIRCRHSDEQSNESKQAIAPAISQCTVQIRRKEGKAKPSQTSQHYSSSNTRGSITGVAVDNIRLHALEAHDGASSEDGSTDIWKDPMRLRLSTPAVPEEPDRYKEGADEHDGDPELGATDSVVLLL